MVNLDVPGIINAAVPEAKGKNARIIEDNMNGNSNHNESGFLSDQFPRAPPKLYITAEDDDFDESILNEWRNEGFSVEYISMGKNGKGYTAKLHGLHKVDLGPCETYGIVAYGDAASACLEHFHVVDNNPEYKLSCLIAYYPSRIPDPKSMFPGGINVVVHLPIGEVQVIKQTQMVGIQGKKRIARRKVHRGLGTGGMLKMAFPAYSYDAEPGFAEKDLEEYDRVCAELAWSRSLATARRAFRKDVNLEAVVDENREGKLYTDRDPNMAQIMSTYTSHRTPCVTYMPTLNGGIGAEEIQHFYSEYFIEDNPESLQFTLVSRTTGVDRVVDELHLYFEHTQEMPWILPGVPPTNKPVEIMVISVVCLRGGKLVHERIYWDQASVLVQIGLLSTTKIPKKAKAQGVKRLPVYGWEPARRVLEGIDDGEVGEADNELIEGFWSEGEGGDDQDDGATQQDNEEADDAVDESVDSADEEIPRSEPLRNGTGTKKNLPHMPKNNEKEPVKTDDSLHAKAVDESVDGSEGEQSKVSGA